MSHINRRLMAGWVTLLFCLWTTKVFSVEKPTGSKEKSASAAKASSSPSSPTENKNASMNIDAALRQQQQIIDEMSRAIHQMRSQLQAQQEEIQRLRTSPPSAAAGQVASLTPVLPAVTAATPGETNLSLPASGSGPGDSGTDEPKSGPLSIRIGKAEFTPGGFLDFTTFFRSSNGGSGIGTSFGSIPFSNTAAGRLTEMRTSAQNSRLALKVTAPVGKENITAYVESDFLGFQPTNAFVTSNSNSLRMRLYWLDVQRDKWEILGGQSWSLLTPNRVGLSPNPGDIFFSQNMDTNYQVGLTWSRDAQFRVVYHANKQWTAGISFESPDQFIGGAVTLPNSAFAGQLDSGGATSTPTVHPDIIAKVAYDANWGGRAFHAEAAGLVRSFRIFNPTTNATSAATGGGGSINANLEVVKNLHLIVNTFYSDGGGRYIFGLGPDLIVRPDGTPSLVHAGSGILGFEYQATPSTMVYSYYGGAYYQKNFGLDSTGKFVGFGYPGSSNSSNRSIQEGTFGVIRTFWKNPQYGALQFMSQYSYLTRNPWSVATGSPKNAHASIAYIDLRYVLP